LKPERKGVINLTTNSEKYRLSNREYQLERKRLARKYIFEALAEFEGYPRSYGFPFDLLANGISKTLDGLEGLANKVAIKALTKLKDHNKSSKC
jgi:hypothetical protein